MRRLKLHWWILIGMVVGALWGTALNVAYLDAFEAAAQAEVLGETFTVEEEIAATREVQQAVSRRFRATFFGGLAHGLATIFLSLLMMVVIPLVFSSLISGVAGMGNARQLGRIGGKAAAWYVTTSLLAVLTGLLLVNLFRPGRGVELPLPISASATVEVPDSGWDLILRFFPTNPFQAAADFDLIHLIFFAVLFGVFLLKVPEKMRVPVVTFFDGAFAVMMKMTLFIIKLAPVGIAALIARLIAQTGPAVFVELAGYALTVAAALAVHFLVTLPLLFWAITRKNPYRVMKAMSPALLTAFSTASSSGTLPLTMQRLEEGVGVGNRTTSFVLPLGATINMDGTALYECVAVLFIANVYAAVNPAFTITLGMQITVVILALVVSIGAAGIPHAGLVMMVIIFQAVGLPIELTALLWAVDRPLDMCRTMVNVWSDSMGTTTIALTEGDVDESLLFAPEAEGGGPPSASDGASVGRSSVG
jgi:proton glutamate symport protein